MQTSLLLHVAPPHAKGSFESLPVSIDPSLLPPSLSGSTVVPPHANPIAAIPKNPKSRFMKPA